MADRLLWDGGGGLLLQEDGGALLLDFTSYTAVASGITCQPVVGSALAFAYDPREVKGPGRAVQAERIDRRVSADRLPPRYVKADRLPPRFVKD